MTIPQDVHDALTRAGGRNLRGQPLYRFAWSGTETYKISNGHAYEEFRICAEDCWLLMKWEAPEFWGSPEEWAVNNRELSGLMTAGPYPSQGRYRVLNKLLKAAIKEDVLTWELIIPNLQFVEEVFPGIREFQGLTTEQRAKHIVDREIAEKARLVKQFGESRKLYKGVATAKQIAEKEAALERYARKNS